MKIRLAALIFTLAVVALAVLAGFLARAPGIPVTAPAEESAGMAGLIASLCGALVLGGSLWWLGKIQK